MPNFVNINSNSTTTLGGQSNHVLLRGVVFNKLGATANTLTLSDATSGAVIGVIDTTRANLDFLDYFGARVAGGLKAVMATGTAADVTLVYD